MLGKDRFGTLDGLRGIAAVAVMTRHVSDHTLLNWSTGSSLAVDLFFILSGFVLMHAYGVRLSGEIPPWQFMKLRWARLYPLYVLGTALVILFIVRRHLNNGESWSDMAGIPFAIAFLPTPPGIGDEHAFPLNFPAWSLFYELVANLIFALLIVRLRGKFLICVIATGAVALGLTVIYFGDISAGSQLDNFWGGAPRVWFGFFAGVLLYQIWNSGWFKAALPLPIAMLILVATFVLEPERGRGFYDFVVVTSVYPVLVLMAANREPSGFVGRLSHHLGLSSYAVYVLQVPLILWVEGGFRRVTGYEFKNLGVAGAVALIIFTLAVALVVDRVYDVPVRRYLTRALRGKQPAPAPAQ